MSRDDSLFGPGSFIPLNATVTEDKNVEVLEGSFGGRRIWVRCIEVKSVEGPFVAVNSNEQEALDIALDLAVACKEDPRGLQAVKHYNQKTGEVEYYYPVITLGQN